MQAQNSINVHAHLQRYLLKWLAFNPCSQYLFQFRKRKLVPIYFFYCLAHLW